MRVGTSCTCLYAVANADSPLNGGFPVTNSYRTMPNEYRSERRSSPSPFACSGEKYVAVPITAPSCVRPPSCAESSARAIPKSTTLMSPFDAIRMFAGLMSRCTTLLRCAYASALAMLPPTDAAERAVRRPWRRNTSASVRPFTNSIAMKYVLPVWPQSYTPTMFGWFKPATLWASRRKRSTKFGSTACSGKRIFTATSRSSNKSRAMNTSAIPPRPMRSWSSYRSLMMMFCGFDIRLYRGYLCGLFAWGQGKRNIKNLFGYGAC